MAPTPPSTLYPRGPLYQPSVLAFDPNQEHKVVQREQVANPAPLGLFAFGEEGAARGQHPHDEHRLPARSWQPALRLFS